jgi:hypothetical protein
MRVAPGDEWRARTIKWVTTALALVAGMALSLTLRAAIGDTLIQAPDPGILKPSPQTVDYGAEFCPALVNDPHPQAERCPHPGR